MTSVAAIRHATDVEWDQAWMASPSATFFESRQWAELWSRYSLGKVRPVPRLVEFSDGTEVVIPACVDEKVGGLVRILRMSPANTYGGWLETSGLTRGHARLLAEIINKSGNLTWLVNPFLVASMDPDTLPMPRGHTLAIDLTGGYDACRARWSKGHRSAAIQARRRGVTIRLADSVDDWRRYFTVYQNSLRRWGPRTTSRYSWALFHGMSSLANVRLWLAISNDQVVAGALCLYHPRQVAYWHGASMTDAFPLRSSNLLLDVAIQHACELGACWFDLGPSGGHVGVEKFKRGFGPSLLDFPLIERSDPVLKIARRIRRVTEAGRTSRIQ